MLPPEILFKWVVWGPGFVFFTGDFDAGSPEPTLRVGYLPRALLPFLLTRLFSVILKESHPVLFTWLQWIAGLWGMSCRCLKFKCKEHFLARANSPLLGLFGTIWTFRNAVSSMIKWCKWKLIRGKGTHVFPDSDSVCSTSPFLMWLKVLISVFYLIVPFEVRKKEKWEHIGEILVTLG